MVPLATLGALAAEEVPVRMEPALPGTWKWLGTKTLSFEYDRRRSTACPWRPNMS
jgi:alpha-2-macroglobulin